MKDIKKWEHLIYKLLPIIFLLFVQLNAQNNNFKLTGIVIDAETNKPIPNVSMEFLDHSHGFISKNDGTFEVSNVQAGNHIIEVKHLGYKENQIEIKINSNKKQIAVYLIPRSIEISQVIVTDKNLTSKFDELYEDANVIEGRELQKDLALTLASTLKNETGLAIRSMGPAPARPVIRGLGSDRVLMSEDGIKTTDLSATSPDHAVTIDPFTLERVEVLRGPRVLLKSSTTIGGVVNVIRNEIPNEIDQHIHGTIGGFGETVNEGVLGSITVIVPFNPFSIRAEISKRSTGNLSTPIGELENSSSENINYSVGGSYIFSFGYLGASYRKFDLQYGVPGGFIGAHPNGIDIEMFRRQINVKSQIEINSKYFSNIDASYSRVLYRHKEFEASDIIGSEFKIINDLGLIHLTNKKFWLFEKGTVGVSFEARDFDIGGFVFTPPSNSLNISTFMYESIQIDKLNFEIGARLSFDEITPKKENLYAKIGPIKNRSFTTYSVSLSTLYSLTERVHIGANLSKSSRVPTIEELFSEGPHLAAYSYEIGDPTLKAESGIGAEVFLYHKFDGFIINVNMFRNDLINYIIPRNTGELNYATFLPIYTSSNVSALLYGIETQIEWEISNKFDFSSSFSYTVGELSDSKSSLPQIPPLKGNLEIKYNNENYSIGLSNEFAFSQNNVDEFEEPTDGYSVFNGFFRYSFQNVKLIHNIFLGIDNFFDKEYRNHLSRVKSILPEAGRNFRLSYKMYFDF
ncbi:MAG: TonB-dependent receptor [Ignavibacteriae bacterium]|nr:TonB-dependent receptor [Ignavibacteriota bacterium]